MIVQVVYLEIQPDKLADIMNEAQTNARASREEPGVVQFDVLQQAGEPLKFMLYEVYKDSEALEAHRHTTHFQRWAEKGVPLLSKERVKVIYEKLS